ncbi:MAG: hypothetical protein HRF43_20810 [Phycisphaerae bacterium]|jgi:hypothetical protein
MNPANANQTRHSDLRWLRWSLSAIALLLAVIAVQLSALIGPVIPRAAAQSPPDSGAQLFKLIEAQTRTNQILQQILDHLRSGEIKVAIPTTDKQDRGAPAPAPRGGPAAPRTQRAPAGR